MADILKQIIADKRIEVAQRKKAVPLELLKEQIKNLPKCRNFHNAATKKNPRGINVIAEVKKASPSAGLIRPDFDPVQIAKTYEKCGADAISVLTDEKYFQGKLEYLTAVKNSVSVPVLRKDFIIDEYQIYEARAAGADAILLIAEAFAPTDGKIVDLMICAAELTLSVLLEVHDAESLLRVRSLIDFPKSHYSVIPIPLNNCDRCTRASEAGVNDYEPLNAREIIPIGIIGINNRDLATMQVDINTTARLAELAGDVIKGLVAESGIKTKADVEKIKKSGATAILIGETLCKSQSIEDKFKELFG